MTRILLLPLTAVAFYALGQRQPPPNPLPELKISHPKTRAELVKFVEEMHADLLKMDASEGKIFKGFMGIAALGNKLSEQSKIVADLAGAAGGSPQTQLLQATKIMQEAQMSFNLQYLQLQSQMQHENRSYTAVSNIMKTKHDTVKNSIGNIR